MPNAIIENILDHARWAPSGDNTQPWRFEIIDANHFVVHGHDTRDYCVYDLEGHASQLSIGILLESIAIAASAYNYRAEFQILENRPESHPAIAVALTEDSTIIPDPLFPFLPVRSVQRRRLKTIPLTVEEKDALEKAVGDYYAVHWIESWQGRWQAAQLMFKNGRLRLTLPEAFRTHSSIIEWHVRFSHDKIPDQAIGLDPIAVKIMQWAMKSWERVTFLNTYLAGTILPRLEMDLLPGIFCAAHFSLIAAKKPENLQDYLKAGRALQRFWLTATRLGLQLQPEMTPLIFAGYVREKLAFTQVSKLTIYAEQLSKVFENLLGGKKPECAVFFGRIGQGEVATTRSLRLSVEQLIKSN
ncbi:nitroreductase family protein [Methylomicrobium sp. RS1]|uniref:nitroreductase family protein n=1 Tax=Candidatus Methylomicrobium oryzae TaxID=2802053 RepID=UPI001923EC7E|nr:nitroreductase family protein [Methylomicrobium sp. RS1]MBL1264946.1 nitroreductase family protein [Methylomicrobium sp. RS1]